MKIFTISIICLCLFNMGYSQCGTVTDYDGNVYNTVIIGNQCWMNENLKTAHYDDGTGIAEIEDSATWVNIFNTNSQAPAWCYYNANDSNNATYGKLYNWYAATDPSEICPTGWHVPSDSDWAVLVNYLGDSAVAGGHLKSTSGLWMAPNTGADNSSGFTALPAGLRYPNGSFFWINGAVDMWSSTQYNSDSAWYFNLRFNSSGAYRDIPSKDFGMSVRCISNSITGVTDIRNSKETVQIYPNPANDVLNIIISNNADGKISLCDITGRVIFSVSTNRTNIQTLNIGNLPAGIYMATYSSSEEIVTTKIVKQ